MTTTTILFLVVARTRWHWSLWKVALLGGLFLVVDLAFLGTNLFKIPDGGWFPLVVAMFVFLLMSTWKKGRARLSEIVLENTLPIDLFLADIATSEAGAGPGHRGVSHLGPGRRAAGAAAPPQAQQGAAREGDSDVRREPRRSPRWTRRDRVQFRELGEGFCEVVANYGFMETPDVPSVLQSLTAPVWRRAAAAGGGHWRRRSIWGGRRSSRSTGGEGGPGSAGSAGVSSGYRAAPSGHGPLAQEALHLHGAERPVGHRFLRLPPNRVVELGAQIQF